MIGADREGWYGMAAAAQQSQPSLWSRCCLRSVGVLPPSAVTRSLLLAPRGADFQLSASHRLTSLHSAAICSLAVDGVECRYLLSADTHGLLALYDTQPSLVRPQSEAGPANVDHTVTSSADAAGRGCGWYVSHPLSSSHVSRSGGGGVGGSSVNSVAWYPVDTGMFVSGSQDGGVHVWDTNAFTIEATFTMRDAAVNCVAMSPLAAASTHSLIAVGSTDLNVRLCDVNSGGFAHTLIGHQAEVTSVCWTPFSEFILATASVDRVSCRHTEQRRYLHNFERRLCIGRTTWCSTLSTPLLSSLSGCSLSVCLPMCVCQTVRLWDIRRSGCLLVFDQFNTAVQDRQFNTVVQDGQSQASSRAASSLSTRYSAAPSLSSSRCVDATSHSASVSHIAFTPSSCHLLSLGTDSRLRVWDPFSGRHLLVHFPHIQCRYRYSRFDVQQRMAGAGQLGERVWLGSGRDVRELPVSGGSGVRHVAHFDRVNAVAVNNRWEEVYSAGLDHSILVWQRQHSKDEQEREDGEAQQSSLTTEQSTRSEAALDDNDWSVEDD